MAMIHVNRGATSLGVFSEEEVREGLRTGRFVPTDIWWREGMANWQPLSLFPELGAVAPAAPPPRPARAQPQKLPPREPVCHGIIGKSAAFPMHLSRPWLSCLRNRAKRSR